ncbi:MAG: hypothetical protein WDN25_30955 [Acetobacteraceae bacterium]
MKQPNSMMPEIGRPRTHRVIVKSANTRPKSFIWEIVHEDMPDRPIQVSTRAFNSMESAYTDGAAVLIRYL